MDKAYLIADLGYGDAGKGATTDFLCLTERAVAVARYNGGAQAGHTVVTADGRRHVFAMYGAGSFVPGVATVLTEHVLVNPLNMLTERDALIGKGVTDLDRRTFVDGAALVTTPFHAALNRLRETARGGGRHGSCGQGIGETRAHALRQPLWALHVCDLKRGTLKEHLDAIREDLLWEAAPFMDGLPDTPAVARDLKVLADNTMPARTAQGYETWLGTVEVVDTHDYLHSLGGTVVFEGAQGVLLDEWYGFHPYTTWTDTTYRNALDLIGGEGVEVVRLGLTRAYATRHGAGPFPSEVGLGFTDTTNVDNPWQGYLRYGAFDFVTARYAIEVLGGIDGVCVSHLDQRPWMPFVDAYEVDGQCVERLELPARGDTDARDALSRLVSAAKPMQLKELGSSPHGEIAEGLGVPLAIGAWGPAASDRSVFSAGPMARLAVEGGAA